MLPQNNSRLDIRKRNLKEPLIHDNIYSCQYVKPEQIRNIKEKAKIEGQEVNISSKHLYTY